MLEVCGAKSIMDLYADVPEQLRFGRNYNLPAARDEQQVRRKVFPAKVINKRFYTPNYKK